MPKTNENTVPKKSNSKTKLQSRIDNISNSEADIAAPVKLARRDKLTLFAIGFAGVMTLIIGCVFTLFAYVNYQYTRSGALSEPQIFEIPKGASLSSIAAKLEKDQLITNDFLFKLVTKLRGNESKFKAGEFSVQRGQSMAQIYDNLANGAAVQYPITIPEGLTSAMILRVFDNFEVLEDDDPQLPPEGSLLPETYNISKNMLQSDLLAQMQRAQTQLLDELWEGRAEDLPIKTRQEAIILASIVEKETGIGAERDKVAGVFINRLRRGMRLQSDPTIIYGVSKGEVLRNRKGERRGIYRSEIDRKTEWNTYQIDGLPPTPICNPGALAIAAVLNPAPTEALFFVADGSGGHVFSKTLREHEANVRNWRRIERARRSKN